MSDTTNISPFASRISLPGLNSSLFPLYSYVHTLPYLSIPPTAPVPSFLPSVLSISFFRGWQFVAGAKSSLPNVASTNGISMARNGNQE